MDRAKAEKQIGSRAHTYISWLWQHLHHQCSALKDRQTELLLRGRRSQATLILFKLMLEPFASSRANKKYVNNNKQHEHSQIPHILGWFPKEHNLQDNSTEWYSVCHPHIV